MATRREIEEALLRGEKVAGICLDTLAKRHLFAFFLSRSTYPIAPFSDEYIDAIKAAYLNTAPEVAVVPPTSGGSLPTGSCRLTRVETKNFGGLNRLGGEAFSTDIQNPGMRVGGYNGKGKTSLASAMVWGLTGARLVSQIGPVGSASVPQPVFTTLASDAGQTEGMPQTIRSWPPVLAYPQTSAPEELKDASGSAEVTLIFSDDAGVEWPMKRSIDSTGATTFDGLSVFGLSEMLVEIAVLMPNRIPSIRIGEGQTEADALVKLLGLEPLGQLADHVADVHHGQKNFARWPSENDVAKAKTAFLNKIGEVEKKLEAISGWARPVGLAGDTPEGKEAECRRMAAELKERASLSTSTVLAEIQPGSTIAQVSNALAGISRSISGGQLPDTDGLKLLHALKEHQATLGALAAKIPDIVLRYEVARQFRELALTDSKLKIKAAAAEWHRKTHGTDIPVTECPLCERGLTDESLLALGRDIDALKAEAESARLSFGETCEALVHDLKSVAEPLAGFKKVRPAPNLCKWIEGELTNWLCHQPDLAVALPRACVEAVAALGAEISELPEPEPPAADPLAGDPLPGEDDAIRAVIARAQVLIRTGVWWENVEAGLTEGWGRVIGTPDANGKFPDGTLLAAHASVMAAIAAATPYSEAAALLESAATEALTWKKLKDEREIRQAIRVAIDDLRSLRTYVASEAKSALKSVSSRAREIFDGIYVADELGTPWASVDNKKSLAVTGRLLNGPTVDARWVANTSWLRAFLWSFYLAFRETTLKRIGGNPLPLMVLDDPQVSFDAAHLKRWGALFARMQQSSEFHEAVQIVVTSYDERFLDELGRQGFQGGRVEVQGIDPERGCLTILSGDALRQAWACFDAADSAKVPDAREKAQTYILRMREHVEGVLKLMLRGQGIEPSDKTVGGLAREFDKRKNVAPFNLPYVRGLINSLNDEKTFREQLNKSHHHEDRKTLDEKDARDVKAVWEGLEARLMDAHRELQIYETVGAHPADDLAGPTTAVIPLDFGGDLKALSIPVHGRVAAATDGRISTVAAVEASKPLNFPNHGVARLATDHLRPVAKSGDLIVYPNYGDPRDGDLVIVAAGKRLRVGRLHLDSKNSGRLVISPVSQDVESPTPPLILPRAHCFARTIVAVASCHNPPIGAAGADDDAIPIVAATELAPLTGDISAWDVQGDSAVPLALDGQTIFCGSQLTSPQAIASQEGAAVLAVVEGPAGEETYFKRLRISGDLVVLENINPQHDTAPIIAGFKAEYRGLKLKGIAPVVGVRFSP